ncbi:hypothetical protein Goklo_022642, partial [Gossypium klotzschianum]|nr:hypothetical protein [Gossypium klotzschianum]
MAETLMHALQYDSYGGGAAALKHVEAPIPTPNKDEILLKLDAISLNPVDWKIQEGVLRPFLPRKFPCIPDWPVRPGIGLGIDPENDFEQIQTTSDVAGEVVKVGPGVTNFKAGDKVVATLHHF